MLKRNLPFRFLHDLAPLAAILGQNSIRIIEKVEKYVHPKAKHKPLAMFRFEESQMAAEILGPGPVGRKSH
jgi:hypothetical protein